MARRRVSRRALARRANSVYYRAMLRHVRRTTWLVDAPSMDRWGLLHESLRLMVRLHELTRG